MPCPVLLFFRRIFHFKHGILMLFPSRCISYCPSLWAIAPLCHVVVVVSSKLPGFPFRLTLLTLVAHSLVLA